MFSALRWWVRWANQVREAETYADNLELVAEGVALRKATADLLGYRSWAHYRLEDRMAGSPETVAAFTGKLQALAQSGLEKDLGTLRAAKRAHLDQLRDDPATRAEVAALEAREAAGPEASFEEIKVTAKVLPPPKRVTVCHQNSLRGRRAREQAWDTGFYHNRVLKEKFGVDAEAIRAYFPLDHVVATTLTVNGGEK